MKTKTTLILLLALSFQLKLNAQCSAPQIIHSTRISTPLDLPPATLVAEKKDLQQLHAQLAEYDRQIEEMQRKKAAAVSEFFEEDAVAAESPRAENCPEEE